MLTIQQISSGLSFVPLFWHSWHGTCEEGCDYPLHPDTVVQVELKDGYMTQGTVRSLCWDHRDSDEDIIKYRVVGDTNDESNYKGPV